MGDSDHHESFEMQVSSQLFTQTRIIFLNL
jgi:pimeloyl-ACP methyl ester carboxylesterase